MILVFKYPFRQYRAPQTWSRSVKPKRLYELTDSDNTLHDQDEQVIEETTVSAGSNKDIDEDEGSQALIESLDHE